MLRSLRKGAFLILVASRWPLESHDPTKQPTSQGTNHPSCRWKHFKYPWTPQRITHLGTYLITFQDIFKLTVSVLCKIIVFGLGDIWQKTEIHSVISSYWGEKKKKAIWKTEESSIYAECHPKCTYTWTADSSLVQIKCVLLNTPLQLFRVCVSIFRTHTSVC